MAIDKFLTALKNLLPNGKAWIIPIGGDHEKFLKSIAHEFERVEAFTENILLESIPSTATNLLPEWVDIYGINTTLPDSTKRNLALTYYTSTGNQSPDYIKDQLLKTGFIVDLIEKDYGQSACGIATCGISSCSSSGMLVFVVAVLTPDEEEELKRLVDYYKPLHIGVIYQIRRSTGLHAGALQFKLNSSGLRRP